MIRLQSLRFPDKRVNELLDYSLDWRRELVEGDTIASSVWTVPAGLNNASDTHSETETTIWLSGGTPGEAVVVNRVVTAGGRTIERAVNITIV